MLTHLTSHIPPIPCAFVQVSAEARRCQALQIPLPALEAGTMPQAAISEALAQAKAELEADMQKCIDVHVRKVHGALCGSMLSKHDT